MQYFLLLSVLVILFISYTSANELITSIDGDHEDFHAESMEELQSFIGLLQPLFLNSQISSDATSTSNATLSPTCLTNYCNVLQTAMVSFYFLYLENNIF